MKKELVDQALASFDAIIRDELDGTDQHKYTRIIAIAAQAHRMTKMGRQSNRVADVADVAGAAGPQLVGRGVPLMGGGIRYVDDEIQNALNGEPPDAPGPMQLLGGIAHTPHPGDMMDTMREVVANIVETDPIAIKSKKLQTLVDARQTMIDAGGDPAVLDDKIHRMRDEITELAAQENKHEPDEHPALVRTEFLRRHQAQGAGQRPLPADRGAGDGARAGGVGEARGAGIEATVVADVGEPA